MYKLDVIEAESKDVQARLSRLYDALETGKLSLDELAPRIRELKATQDELVKVRFQIETDMATGAANQIDKSSRWLSDMRQTYIS